VWIKKIECAQRFLSVLSMSVGVDSVECGVWSVEYDSAVSGEPPLFPSFSGGGVFISVTYSNVE
jgi:hypothetical protein